MREPRAGEGGIGKKKEINKRQKAYTCFDQSPGEINIAYEKKERPERGVRHKRRRLVRPGEEKKRE